MSSMGLARALQLAWLGEAYLLEGRLDDALRHGHEALRLARRQQERGHEAWSLRLLGEVTSRRDPSYAETAEGHYRDALSLADELGMRPLAAHCHSQLAKLMRQGPRSAQGRQHRAAATTMYREMGMRIWLDRLDPERQTST